MARSPDDEDLARVRRAAFELAGEDPARAVRELRRLARRGDDIEVLARGALGEILLDQYGDAEGALHEFEAVLRRAPDLAAAEMGRARALARGGRLEEAAASRARAVSLLLAPVRAARGTPAEPSAGLEESVLTALELALEELDEPGAAAARAARPEDDLLDWAERERLFDAEEDEGATDDWIRYGALRGLLLAREHRAVEALALVDRVGAAAPLPPATVRHLRSLVREASGELAAAAEDARASLADRLADADPEDLLRAARLLVESGQAAPAESFLAAARAARAAAPVDAEQQEAVRLLDEALASLPRPRLVSLGVRPAGERP